MVSLALGMGGRHVEESVDNHRHLGIDGSDGPWVFGCTGAAVLDRWLHDSERRTSCIS